MNAYPVPMEAPASTVAVAGFTNDREPGRRSGTVELTRPSPPGVLEVPEHSKTEEIGGAPTIEDEMADLMARTARARLTSAWSALIDRAHGVLVRNSIMALRLALGAVFLGFGILKFFPGISPAENLAVKTLDILSFGLLPGHIGILIVATLECFIGICLLANRWMRLAVGLLAVELVGILSPVVLLTGRLFSGPHNAPTLEGQYVLKDVILVAATMVIAACTFKGGHLVCDERRAGRRSFARLSHFIGQRRPMRAGRL